MRKASHGSVVIDTGVFGAHMTPKGKLLASGYRPLFEGRPSIISFVTVAELQFGAAVAGWGGKRLQRLYDELRQTKIAWANPDIANAYVKLRAWCVKNGHGLGHKEHEADRWVAATAIMLGVPLVAHDAIFINVDGLQLNTRL